MRVFGSYVHNPDEDRKRVLLFEQLGYKCLVVWDYEIYPKKNRDQLVAKLRSF